MAQSSAETRLMNKAVDYLGRFASSSHRLATVLDRFAKRKLGDYDPKDVADAIANTIARCRQLGYIDDTAFAAGQARNHRRLGRSSRSIRQRLAQHHIDPDLIATAIDAADQTAGDGDLLAAFVFARRRRIGPFDPQLESADSEMIQNQSHIRAKRHRQLGALARGGFAMDICLKVIDCPSRDDAEATIEQLETAKAVF
jgi:regulatory protein